MVQQAIEQAVQQGKAEEMERCAGIAETLRAKPEWLTDDQAWIGRDRCPPQEENGFDVACAKIAAAIRTRKDDS